MGCTTGCVVDPIPDQIEHYMESEHYMDMLSARQKLAASNVANAGTPEYKTKDIDFQFEFMSQIKNGTPNMMDAPGLVVESDCNNVSIDRKARLFSENALRFNMAAAAIQEGKSE